MSGYQFLGRNGTARVRRLLIGALCVLLSSAGLARRAEAVSVPPLERPQVAPLTGALFGSYVKPFTGGWNVTDWKSAVGRRESDLGRTFDINHHYYAWDTALPGWKLDWDVQDDRYSMVSWDAPASLSSVTSGAEDAWVRRQADALAAFGHPVFIRWLWEMDTRAGQVGSPETFIAAWRRVHGIFDARGATNALWTWCPTAYGFTTGDAQRYYPGDAYVDWICSDGYNWAPGRPGAPWRSFKDIFKSFYDWGTAQGKPLMVGETGTEERAAGEKASWFSEIVPALKSHYPNVKALVYFDSATTDLSGDFFTWRPDTSQSAYTAYKAMAADPYLNARLDLPVDPPVEPPPTEPPPTEPPPTEPPPTDPPPTDPPPTDPPPVDELAPPVLTAPSRAVQSSRSIAVAWTGKSSGGFELRRRGASPSGPLAGSAPVVTRVSGWSATFEGRPGHTYCFSARAAASGQVSGWSDERCTAIPLDDASFRRRGRWVSKTAAASYGGSYASTTRRGARLVRSGVRAKRLILLARTCRTCGAVRVLWNGRPLGRFSLRSTGGTRSIRVAHFSGVRYGTLKIVVRSRGRHVAIDGLAAVRT